MSGEQKLSGPDLSQGITLAELGDGKMLLGHAGGEAVLLVRQGNEIFAVGATCTHYSGPLSDCEQLNDDDRRRERAKCYFCEQ